MSYQKELSFAVDAVRAAAPLALGRFGHAERLTKSHAAASNEAVTAADREVQAALVAAIRRQFPGDGLIGEEDDCGRGITFECRDPLGRNWVIDPVDGTNNFIAGLGCWCVCVGLLDRGEPVMGVVYDATRDLMYAASRGGGATLNGKAIAAQTTPLSAASIIMLTSNTLDKTGKCPKWAGGLLSQTEWKIRILGSAALEAVSVASGVAHAAITINGKLWDCAAPAAIVLEAGGTICDTSGAAVFPFALKDYAGAKVPYIAAGTNAVQTIIDFMNCKAR